MPVSPLESAWIRNTSSHRSTLLWFAFVKTLRKLKTLFLDLSLVLPSVQVQNVTAEYIMKCDDDTFVRVDSVLEEVQATSIGEGLYLGSMNEFHRPLRTGKWAVTFEVFSVKTHVVCVSLILLILWLR